MKTASMDCYLAYPLVPDLVKQEPRGVEKNNKLNLDVVKQDYDYYFFYG